MPLHRSFRRGTHILIIFHTGEQIHGRFINADTKFLWVHTQKLGERHELKLNWTDIRATTIYKHQPERKEN
jgi:hypothetical protein